MLLHDCRSLSIGVPLPVGIAQEAGHGVDLQLSGFLVVATAIVVYGARNKGIGYRRLHLLLLREGVS